MKLPVIAVRLLFAMTGLSTCLSAAEISEKHVARFRQDRFVIGAFWLTFPDDKKLDERFREIDAANFTLVFGPVGGFSAQNAKKHVELCKKYDLRALVLCRGVSDAELPNDPACWGYP